MKNVQDDELNVLLNRIQNHVLIYVDTLFECIEPFFLETTQNKFPQHISDFYKLNEGIRLLQEEIKKIPINEWVKLQKNDFKKVSSHLLKLRHDLKNYINIINGYSELTLEILQEAEADFLIAKLLKLQTVLRKIINQVNEIKEPVTSEIFLESEDQFFVNTEHQNDLDEVIYLDEDIEPAYLEYKKDVKILIIDDFKEDCLILDRYLRRLGYENIKIAMDGFQGLQAIKTDVPDLVLMDIDMPGISGIEMLLFLREKIIHQELMVLMISAYDHLQNVVACIKNGAVDFLPKPFNKALLKVRIEACIKKKWFIHKNNKYREEIKNEKNRYEHLLHSVFPSAIVKELAETSSVAPKIYDQVAVLFIDIAGFTSFCETHTLEEISSNIQIYAEICERAAIKHHLQKLKTIGDGFMAVGGMLSKSSNPVVDSLECALEIIRECAKMDVQWRVRGGIDLGTVIGGIVGHRQYLFDIWGDVVNTCARILGYAEPNSVCLTSTAWEKCNKAYKGDSLGFKAVKGKSQKIEIFQVTSVSHLR